eukprot:TRINITY_DN2266_c0_g3_i1.p1 TRINITY_DN2266_c0_g3~~TRINITY_DN2266_c0_g3_i1.p1  ORF type:complete len:158 (+),score=21.43 TRINITY_DN2266_c0_g3_i1:153-626(+)
MSDPSDSAGHIRDRRDPPQDNPVRKHRRTSYDVNNVRVTRKKTGKGEELGEAELQYIKHCMGSQLTLDEIEDLVLKKFNRRKQLVITTWNCLKGTSIIDQYVTSQTMLHNNVFPRYVYETELDNIQREQLGRQRRLTEDYKTLNLVLIQINTKEILQ